MVTWSLCIVLGVKILPQVESEGSFLGRLTPPSWAEGTLSLEGTEERNWGP